MLKQERVSVYFLQAPPLHPELTSLCSKIHYNLTNPAITLHVLEPHFLKFFYIFELRFYQISCLI